MGYKILESENGLVALQILREHDYNIDLIITDLIMPEMDGIELYNEIQKLKPDIKFLFISGYTDETLSEIGVKINKIKFLRKPFNIKEISSEIRKILEK